MINFLTWLETILPGGTLTGTEYTVLNPTRPDHSPGSFKINIKTAVWSDFSTSDRGSDPISLYAYINKMSQSEAAKALRTQFPIITTLPEKSKKDPHKWIPVLPVPENAPDPPQAHYHYGSYTKKWHYRDVDGKLIGYACRFDRKNNKKEILPLTYCKNSDDKCEWYWHSFNPPRPMYGLERLARFPKKTVLLVEGEKCADVAANILGDIPVLSWIGGSKAVKKIDFSPLQEKEVILWPDNDKSGIDAMQKLREIISGIVTSSKIITPPENKPLGWDVADAVAEGWGRLTILDFISQNATVSKPENQHLEITKKFNLTDSGNAWRLIHYYGDQIRYNEEPFGKWLLWDGKRWQIDKTKKIFEFVDKVVIKIYQEASYTIDSEKRKELGKAARQLESMHCQKSVVAKAETIQSNAITLDKLDQDIYKFNVLNCTLDLSNGEPAIQNHNPLDLITQIANVEYFPEAECPNWLEFLDDIFNNNASLIQFVQQAIGYSLTGNVGEQCLFFAYGTGGNGKSVFFETIKELLGDYAGKAPTEMIMQQPFSTVPTDIADLKGKRFVVAAEIEEGRRLAESCVKDLTGNDTIPARRMRENYFTFKPTHKLWIYGNYKPTIHGTDEGIRRRIIIIPFIVTIPPEKKIKPDVLMEKFCSEFSGILNWALEGYTSYREKGFIKPNIMIEAVEEYFNDMDIIGQFIAECCFVNTDVSYNAKCIWEHYHDWCESRGVRSVSNIILNRKLKERGFTVRASTGNKMTVFGLALKTEEVELNQVPCKCVNNDT